MAELILLVKRNKSEVVSALKMKAALEKTGIQPSGMFMMNDGKDPIPPEFIEDLVGLKVMGYIANNPGPS
jgi:hypothetical protein